SSSLLHAEIVSPIKPKPGSVPAYIAAVATAPSIILFLTPESISLVFNTESNGNNSMLILPFEAFSTLSVHCFWISYTFSPAKLELSNFKLISAADTANDIKLANEMNNKDFFKFIIKLLVVYTATNIPPSTNNRWPLTKSEALEARKTAEPINSSGSPQRSAGVL